MVNRYSFFICLFICFLLIPFDTSSAEIKKTKIAVLDFELRGDTFKTKDMGGIVAEWFITALVQDGRFQVVERALLKKIVDEQKLGMTGLIDESSSSQLGKILGVKTIITGSVLQIQDTLEVNARIINVSTGSIVAAENIRSKTSGNLKEAIERLTSKIVKNFPLTGYVVKKHDNTVLIDLGATSGLQTGMEFIVFKEGDAIKHPKTGEVLEVEQIRTGLIKITEYSANTATAVITKVEPKQEIRYGQLVQSVRKKEARPEEKTEPQIVQKEIIVSKAPSVEEKKPQNESPKPIPKKNDSGYLRSEFLPGERDNLAAGGQGPALLPLPTGTFMMGSDKFPEKPAHYVKIDRQVFFMVTEVTFEEYEKFCLETGAVLPDDSSWGRKDRPVINVSWHDAQAYANWLSKQTGATYRLPSESEWEWASGAGSGTTYTWGNTFKPDMANCKTCSSQGESTQTVPTRTFPANKYGFHDMPGNVWEWVQDCWVENYINASDNQSPRNFTGNCSNFTLRGGGWNSPTRQITTTSRLGVSADTKSNYIGFRLVKDSGKPTQREVPVTDSLPAALPLISSSKTIANPAVAPEMRGISSTAAKKAEEETKKLSDEKKKSEEIEKQRLAAEIERLSKEKAAAQSITKIAGPVVSGSSSAKTFTDPITGMEFVLVPGGCFLMGDTIGDGELDEKPVHEVCIDGFYMGKYEVTQGQYRTVTGKNLSKFQKGDNYPVEKASWNDVQSFIRSLNDKSGNKYRLPTEAEWEYAARSGGRSEKYAGGNDIDAVAWYTKNGGGSTNPVGQKQPTNLGLYDMSGNVREWCGDWYDSGYYGSSPRNNPEGSSSGSDHVVRGGSWGGGPGDARVASRFAGAPGFVSVDLGFRLILPVQRP
jgi:formylglycine-generating enzyme required for sulfatase activity/TolB-like protein